MPLEFQSCPKKKFDQGLEWALWESEDGGSDLGGDLMYVDGEGGFAYVDGEGGFPYVDGKGGFAYADGEGGFAHVAHVDGEDCLLLAILLL